MSGGIANLISDFSNPAPSEGFGIGILRRVRQVPEPEIPAPQPEVDHQAELLQALESRVRAEEKEQARQQLEEALIAERERHLEDLATQRKLWVEQEAMQLASQLNEAIGGLEASLSEKAARILAAVIPDALRQNAIAEFSEVLGTVLSGETAKLLKVTGPEDLLNAMKAWMPLRADLLEFVPNNDVELTLIADDTTVQTQFSAWSTRLQAFLKVEPS